MNMFSTYRLGSMELKNRIVMAPMTRSRAVGSLPNELMRAYYAERAGAGLIISEGIAPSSNGLGYARIPGLFEAAQIAGFRAITDDVHERGGRMFAQLMHVGRVAHVHNMPQSARVVAPSAVTAAGNMWTDQEGLVPFSPPEAMNAADLRQAREEFVQAARNAITAGFDGVELHAANGYLLEQFLNPHANRREDAYGGTPEGRARFVAEVAASTAEAIGAERVGIRLSPYNTFNDLPLYDGIEEQYEILARQLRGLVYVHLVRSISPSFGAAQQAITRAYGGAIMLNGGFDARAAQAALDAGQADLVSFGRPFIANPDLVERMKRGAPLAEPRPELFYTPGAEGYTDYRASA